MPFTFLSHQAAALPLKLAWPQRVSGLAAAIGSMAPDFEFFLTGRAQWDLGHTLRGQFLFCLPLTLAMTWIVARIIAGPLARRLPDAGAFHLRDYQLLEHTTQRRGYWLAAIPWALFGSFSHIGWDSFTHAAGSSARRLGYATAALTVGSHSILVVKLLQHGSTLVGALVTLAVLRRIGRNRLLRQWAGADHLPTVVDRPGGSALLWLCPAACAALVLAVSGYGRTRPLPATGLDGLVAIVLRSFTAGFVGLCIGCLLLRARDRPQEQAG